MRPGEENVELGLEALRLALARALHPGYAAPLPAAAPTGGARAGGPNLLLSEVVDYRPAGSSRHRGTGGSRGTSGSRGEGETDDDSRSGPSAQPDRAQANRLAALVELARTGDSEAFALLYDHYHPIVYRFLYYRTGSVTLTEDLTSETFVRALRGIGTFRWQGKDFGAWLTTIARNLAVDHFKSGRVRLEHTTEDMGAQLDPGDGPESAVLTSLTNRALLTALRELPREQRDCLIMRFLQGFSIADTARVLDAATARSSSCSFELSAVSRSCCPRGCDEPLELQP